MLSLWCALPLTSSGRFLGCTDPFLPFSFALTLRNRVERFDTCAQRFCELLDRAGVTSSLTRFYRRSSDVTSLSLSWSMSGGGGLPPPLNLMPPPPFSFCLWSCHRSCSGLSRSCPSLFFPPTCSRLQLRKPQRTVLLGAFLSQMSSFFELYS